MVEVGPPPARPMAPTRDAEACSRGPALITAGRQMASVDANRGLCEKTLPLFLSWCWHAVSASHRPRAAATAAAQNRRHDRSLGGARPAKPSTNYRWCPADKLRIESTSDRNCRRAPGETRQDHATYGKRSHRAGQTDRARDSIGIAQDLQATDGTVIASRRWRRWST